MAKDTKPTEVVAEAPPVSEEEARQLSQDAALKAAEARNAAQDDLMTQLMADQEKMRQAQVELEAKLDELRREQGKPAVRKPITLRGAVDADAEKLTQAAVWPKDAGRKPGPVVTKTFAVTPVGAAVEQGFGPAIVTNCYDSSDAKAAYMKQYKPEMHHLPVQIHEVLPTSEAA